MGRPRSSRDLPPPVHIPRHMTASICRKRRKGERKKRREIRIQVEVSSSPVGVLGGGRETSTSAKERSRVSMEEFNLI